MNLVKEMESARALAVTPAMMCTGGVEGTMCSMLAYGGIERALEVDFWEGLAYCLDAPHNIPAGGVRLHAPDPGSLLDNKPRPVQAWAARPEPCAFLLDGRTVSLSDLVAANCDDAEVCDWARNARPGDRFAALCVELVAVRS